MQLGHFLESSLKLKCIFVLTLTFIAAWVSLNVSGEKPTGWILRKKFAEIITRPCVRTLFPLLNLFNYGLHLSWNRCFFIVVKNNDILCLYFFSSVLMNTNKSTEKKLLVKQSWFFFLTYISFIKTCQPFHMSSYCYAISRKNSQRSWYNLC